MGGVPDWRRAQLERQMNPPEGWFVFGTHVGPDDPLVEFSEELDPEDGLPMWERPMQ